MASLEPNTSIVATGADSARVDYDKKDHADEVSLTEKGAISENELDGIHDGLEFPTEEEIETLRRVSDAIPWTAYRKLPGYTRKLLD